ncbi:MFS transporter [Ligilactobacillus murinus]|uniref:MFS transporter n=1 Tax=Ligilactobacillus murinus TaxID=1622 RepID=UPI00109441C1|nr:MFS transporter [Ligilactobacillus murinus]TGY53468.1 MFS transporter [Ligilactobacillus murinus]
MSMVNSFNEEMGGFMFNCKKRERKYFSPLFSQFLSNFGDGVFISILTLVVANYSNSAKDLSFVLSMYSLPWLIFSIVAGSIIDRIGAYKVSIYSNFMRMLLLVILSVLTFVYEINLLLIIIFALIIGCLEVLFDNSFGVLLPKFVTTSDLERINGISSTLEIVANKFLGVNVGSLLVSLTLLVALPINSIFYLLSAMLIFFSIDNRNDNVNKMMSRKDSLFKILKKDIILGLKYLTKDSKLTILVILGVVWNICYGIEQIILVLFIKQMQSNYNIFYTLVISSAALGGIVGGLLVGKLSKIMNKKQIIVLAVGLYVASFLIKYAYYMEVFVLLGSFIAGVSEIFLNTISVSYRQRTIPQGILGRVSTPIRLFIVGSVTVGNLLGGILGSVLNYRLLGIGLAFSLLTSTFAIYLLSLQKMNR